MPCPPGFPRDHSSPDTPLVYNLRKGAATGGRDNRKGIQMEYTQGALGRVFVACLHDGESLYEAVQGIAGKEGIASAAVMAIGGMRSGRVVTGPVNSTGKVEPHFEEFDDAREMVGFGTLFMKDGAPALHFHAGIGRRDSALVGCPRGGMAVYLTLEVVIIELLGVRARREFQPEFGLHLLRVLGKVPDQIA